MNYSGSNYKDAENYKDGIGVWTDTIDEQYIYISSNLEPITTFGSSSKIKKNTLIRFSKNLLSLKVWQKKLENP